MPVSAQQGNPAKHRRFVMKMLLAVAVVLTVLGLQTSPSGAEEILTGDTRLACEATLCLSSGTKPSECSPSLERYFGIHKKSWNDTIKARHNFLKLCPASDESSEMDSLTKAIAQGAGHCDAASLNMVLKTVDWGGDGYHISNEMPSYCVAYTSHEYTDLTTAVYVGTPDKGGFWTEPENYDKALAKYEAELRKRSFGWR
jgi:hypothetical protein